MMWNFFINLDWKHKKIFIDNIFILFYEMSILTQEKQDKVQVYFCILQDERPIRDPADSGDSEI